MDGTVIKRKLAPRYRAIMCEEWEKSIMYEHVPCPYCDKVIHE